MFKFLMVLLLSSAGAQDLPTDKALAPQPATLEANQFAALAGAKVSRIVVKQYRKRGVDGNATRLAGLHDFVSTSERRRSVQGRDALTPPDYFVNLRT